MSTVKANTYQDASGGNTATINSMTPTADSLQGFRNRIINGDMRIDQRNAGAAVTVNNASGSNFYAVDRFFGQGQTTDGVFTMQRSTTAPAGFTNSLLTTVTTADASLSATQVYQIVQAIEGFNTADLGWGTANAKTVTLSFWVRSSVTGTFGGALFNATAARSYPFSYSISSANTFEYKTVTIAGDTTGTWGTDNGVGIYVIFSLGAGATYSGTAGSWAGTQYNSATGATNLMATLNATFYITGVQLEVGSTATPFERRPYGTELMLCQRYYQTIYNLMACAAGTTQIQSSCQFPVPMRAAPTIGQGGSGTGLKFTDGTSDFNPTSFSFTNQNTTSQGFFGLFPNYSSLTSRSALSLASDGGRWVTLSIEL